MTEKTAEFCCLVEKGHVWKESGVTTQGRKEVEVDTVLLGSDKSNAIVNKVLSYFVSFKCMPHVLVLKNN